MSILMNYLSVLFGTICMVSGTDFDAEYKKVLARYQEIGSKVEVQAVNGALDTAAQMLIDFVPDSEKTKYHYLALGNLLFSLDPELSLEMHRKAYELDPEEPLILKQWAIQRHRSGYFAEAIFFYEQLPEVIHDSQLLALLADCHFNLNQPKEGIKAWLLADHRENSASIEEAIYWIYGEEDSRRKRAAILKKPWTKKTAIELLKLDLDWVLDWWNAGVNEKLLDIDMPRFQQVFSTKEMALVELVIAVAHWHDSTSGKIKLTPEKMETRLKELNVILDGGSLPEQSYLLAMLVDYLFSVDLLELEDIWDPLERMAFSESGELDHLKILSDLAMSEGYGDQEAIFRLGVTRFHDPHFMSNLLSLKKGENLQISDPDLLLAMNEFPDEPTSWLAAWSLAEDEGMPFKGFLLQLIKTEFKGFKSNAYRHSTYLNNYILALEKL